MSTDVTLYEHRCHRCEAVLTSTHNLCFEQKYEKYQNFLYENVHFLVVRFSVYFIGGFS